MRISADLAHLQCPEKSVFKMHSSDKCGLLRTSWARYALSEPILWAAAPCGAGGGRCFHFGPPDLRPYGKHSTHRELVGTSVRAGTERSRPRGRVHFLTSGSERNASTIMGVVQRGQARASRWKTRMSSCAQGIERRRFRAGASGALGPSGRLSSNRERLVSTLASGSALSLGVLHGGAGSCFRQRERPAKMPWFRRYFLDRRRRSDIRRTYEWTDTGFADFWCRPGVSA